jgi:two-component system LytT family sensor kinase
MKFSARHHILFWTGYLVWDVLQPVFSMYGSFTKELKPALITTALTMPVKIALSIFLLQYTVRPLVVKNSKARYPLVLAIAVTVILLLLVRAIVFFIALPKLYGLDMSKGKFFNLSSLTVSLFDLLVPACLLIIYELYRYTLFAKDREMKLEKEKLTSELSFLKAQINPHFLFNVLSTVHALSRNKAPEAADVTMKLSKLMRFMLFETKRKAIAVAEEIKILEDYIELEKVRFSNKLTIRFEKDIDDETRQITPLILLPFVENAFKHGSSESRFHSFVYIKLVINKGMLRFEIENSIEDPIDNNKSTYIGLTNIKRQLELVYPDHELMLQKKEQTFFVALQFKLQPNE